MNLTDKTGNKQGRWVPGQSGNPAGRPRGARNKLSESLLTALADDFDAHGRDVIAKVRENHPHEYLRVIAATLPKRLETEPADRPLEELTDEELAQMIRDTEQALAELGLSSADVERQADQPANRATGERFADA